jgi:hypothetical protein
LNGKNKVWIRTLNGKQSFDNQRYSSLDKSVQTSFLDSYCGVHCPAQGYQSSGLLELMSEYASKLSYSDTSLLLKRFMGESIYTGSQIQHKILDLEPLISTHLQSIYNHRQLSFHFVDPHVALYDASAPEVCYLDDAIGVTKQNAKRSDPTYEKELKYVQTDVVLVQNPDHSYHYFNANRFRSSGLDLETQIECYLSVVYQSVYGTIPFVAITDGARSIRCRIERIVGSERLYYSGLVSFGKENLAIDESAWTIKAAKRTPRQRITALFVERICYRRADLHRAGLRRRNGTAAFFGGITRVFTETSSGNY